MKVELVTVGRVGMGFSFCFTRQHQKRRTTTTTDTKVKRHEKPHHLVVAHIFRDVDLLVVLLLLLPNDEWTLVVVVGFTRLATQR